MHIPEITLPRAIAELAVALVIGFAGSIEQGFTRTIPACSAT